MTFIRHEILPINRRKQPANGSEKTYGVGVYSKTLLSDGFSVETRMMQICASQSAAMAWIATQH